MCTGSALPFTRGESPSSGVCWHRGHCPSAASELSQPSSTGSSPPWAGKPPCLLSAPAWGPALQGSAGSTVWWVVCPPSILWWQLGTKLVLLSVPLAPEPSGTSAGAVGALGANRGRRTLKKIPPYGSSLRSASSASLINAADGLLPLP